MADLIKGKEEYLARKKAAMSTSIGNEAKRKLMKEASDYFMNLSNTAIKLKQYQDQLNLTGTGLLMQGGGTLSPVKDTTTGVERPQNIQDITSGKAVVTPGINLEAQTAQLKKDQYNMDLAQELVKGGSLPYIKNPDGTKNYDVSTIDIYKNPSGLDWEKNPQDIIAMKGLYRDYSTKDDKVKLLDSEIEKYKNDVTYKTIDPATGKLAIFRDLSPEEIKSKSYTVLGDTEGKGKTLDLDSKYKIYFNLTDKNKMSYKDPKDYTDTEKSVVAEIEGRLNSTPSTLKPVEPLIGGGLKTDEKLKETLEDIFK